MSLLYHISPLVSLERESKLLQVYQISLPLDIVYDTNNMQICGPLQSWMMYVPNLTVPF